MEGREGKREEGFDGFARAGNKSRGDGNEILLTRENGEKEGARKVCIFRDKIGHIAAGKAGFEGRGPHP